MEMHPVLDVIQEEIEKTGWNADSLLGIALGFIDDEGLVDDFSTYAKRRANYEYAEGAGLAGRDEEA